MIHQAISCEMCLRFWYSDRSEEEHAADNTKENGSRLTKRTFANYNDSEEHTPDNKTESENRQKNGAFIEG
jgi:hypothetical protein